MDVRLHGSPGVGAGRRRRAGARPGKRAGARGADGNFPPDTVNRLVEDRLIELAEKRRAFALRTSEEGAA